MKRKYELENDVESVLKGRRLWKCEGLRGGRKQEQYKVVQESKDCSRTKRYVRILQGQESMREMFTLRSLSAGRLQKKKRCGLRVDAQCVIYD